jgi:hypothetical protein
MVNQFITNQTTQKAKPSYLRRYGFASGVGGVKHYGEQSGNNW